MPKHELYCSHCGDRMVFECKTTDEAKCLLDNEYVCAIQYARLKEQFLLTAARITHQTIEEYNSMPEGRRAPFESTEIQAIYTCLVTIPDGACRAKMREYANAARDTIPYFIYHTNVMLFDLMMKEGGFDDFATNEERQGALKTASHTRENPRGDNTPSTRR